MILAGGLSTRLYPLTKTMPKPLVPVLGEPNVAHVIRYLRGYGVTDIATNVFYFAGDVRAALGDGSRYGVRLHYLDETSLSGSAGAVKLMEPFLRESDPFVVVGCDDVTNLDLRALIAFHRERGATATIGLVEREDVREYGVVVVDASGKVAGFQEKPEPGEERSHLVNTGIYVFSPQIFERIPSGEVYDFGKQVFPELQRDGAPFYGYRADAYWCDIGTPGEYRRVTRDLLAGSFSLPGLSPSNGSWISPRARISPDATVAPPSVVGDDVTIEPGARVEGTILWQGAVVGRGAALRDCIVGARYRVAPGLTLRDAIVANEEGAAE